MSKRIAILTGGGDVPGLNAAIKAFVGRLLDHDGYEILGLRRGWASLLNIIPEPDADNSAWITPLGRINTRSIDRFGGTMLHTSRINPSISKLEHIPAHLLPLKGEPDEHGRYDLTAAALRAIDFLELDYASWRRVIDISLDGTFHCAQATLPGMIAKGWGRIIALGGISWHAGTKARAHNLAAKAGLTGLTRALAVEFGDRGITANVISPGAIETVRPASAGVSPLRHSTPPVPRRGHVEEIASAALFLAQPEQGYLTGQIIHVNGGMYLGT